MSKESTEHYNILSELRKVTGCKTNTQKPITLLHTNNEYTETKDKNIIQLTMAPKKIKFLGIHLTKDVLTLYNESYKIKKKKKER